MDTTFLLLLFLTGLAAAVAINSLADDLPPDELGVRRKPRPPHCRRCGRPHQPALWLGLAGWLFRQGRCQHCGGRRPLRHILVELATALSLPLLWLWANDAGAVHLPLIRFAAAATIALSFMLIAVIDIEHRLILRVVILPAALLVAIVGWLHPAYSLSRVLLGGLAGYAIMFSLFLLAEIYSRAVGRLRGQPLDEVALGGGDVNLAAVVGLAVGWPAVLFALVIAIIAGGAYSLGFIIVQLVRGRYNPHTAMPYGPFLIFGALAIYLFGQQIVRWWYGM